MTTHDETERKKREELQAEIESIVPEAKTMTDEEAAAFLRLALTSEEARGYLKKRTEGGKSE